MLHKLLTSGLPVIILQYSMLLLLCVFLYRIISLIYRDFYRRANPALAANTSRTAKLKVVSRGFLVGGQSEIPLGETLNIGRSEHNDVVINEATVSFEHACIAYCSGKYLLSDLQSTNGTLYNNSRLQDDARLRQGDTITIGSTIFQFEE